MRTVPGTNPLNTKCRVLLAPAVTSLVGSAPGKVNAASEGTHIAQSGERLYGITLQNDSAMVHLVAQNNKAEPNSSTPASNSASVAHP